MRASWAMPSASSIWAAACMVPQSDWLPMMIPTDGALLRFAMVAGVFPTKRRSIGTANPKESADLTLVNHSLRRINEILNDTALGCSGEGGPDESRTEQSSPLRAFGGPDRLCPPDRGGRRGGFYPARHLRRQRARDSGERIHPQGARSHHGLDERGGQLASRVGWHQEPSG